MKINNNKALVILIFFIVFLFVFSNKAAAMVDSKIPQWVSFNASFDNEPVELNSIANLKCEISSLIVTMEGYVEVSFPDTVKSIAPLLKYNFKLNASEKKMFRFPLQFISESYNKPISVKTVLKFPEKELYNYVNKDNSISEPLKKELIDKIKSASKNFELSQTIDFIITKKEGFLNLQESVYSYYFDDGYVIADEAPAGVDINDISQLKKEINKFEDFIATIRKNKELQSYLETNMDMVSGEDKYLKLLMAAGNYNLKKDIVKDAGAYYELIINNAVNEPKNIDTSEIFVSASNNLLVTYLKSKKIAEALKILVDSEKKAPRNGNLRYLYYNIGMYYKNINNKAEAVKFLRKALNLKPNFTVCSDELKKLENY